MVQSLKSVFVVFNHVNCFISKLYSLFTCLVSQTGCTKNCHTLQLIREPRIYNNNYKKTMSMSMRLSLCQLYDQVKWQVQVWTNQVQANTKKKPSVKSESETDSLSLRSECLTSQTQSQSMQSDSTSFSVWLRHARRGTCLSLRLTMLTKSDSPSSLSHSHRYSCTQVKADRRL